MKSKAKEYNVKNIKDIANMVTPENYENFIVDLKNALEIYVSSIAVIRAMQPDAKDKTNSELMAFEKMVWIDDGEHKQTITVTNVNAPS